MAGVYSEPWRECCHWLTRCGVLRQDHKLNWSDSGIQDLACTLRDGVLLCSLLNTLDPGCIDMKDVNQKPQLAQFLCLRNIKTFRTACRDIFGLRENDLFEPSMLFDCSDFYQVLSTLSKLSTCSKVQKNKIEGFSIDGDQSHFPEYSLNVRTEEVPGTCSYELTDDEEYGCYSRIRTEEIYQDLCVTRSQSQSATSTGSVEKRDYVINELVDTEKNYVDMLTTTMRCFVRPLSGLLKDDADVIFKDLKELTEIHSSFLKQLHKATGSRSSTKLGDAFLESREKFLIYADYCSNLQTAQARIQEVCQKSEIINQQIIKCQQEANNGKFELRDVLMVPMQRILKYHLLLQRLIDETQPNHDEYRNLERAKEAMLDVTEYINEVKRDTEKLHIVNVIQERVQDLDLPENTTLKSYGRLIIDGELKIKAHDDQKQRTRWVFVFDQMILMCKSMRNEQYNFKESLHLAEYKVEEGPNRKIVTQNSRWGFQWYLVQKTRSTAYTMYASTIDLKMKWVKAVQEAIDNVEPAVSRNTNHKFAMHTFTEPTTCNQCSKYLKGLLFQGYQCEKCSISMHKCCIPVSGRCSRSERLTPPPIEERTDRPQRQSFKEYLWFVGPMERERATELLEDKEDGTYLLRIRPRGPTNHDETVYALSLKADHKVKHMKVYQKDIDSTTQYYLSESRFFRSIVDLINCYERSSLRENFVGLDVCLTSPFRKIVARSEFDFTPTAGNQLMLTKGCFVVVLSKEGDYKGWWKGKIQGCEEVGFFPKNYVREISDTFTTLGIVEDGLQVMSI